MTSVRRAWRSAASAQRDRLSHLPATSSSSPSRSALPIPHSPFRIQNRPPPISLPSILKKIYRKGQIDIPVLTGVEFGSAAGRISGDRRPKRLRQKHAACICWVRWTHRLPAKFISTDKRIDNLPAGPRTSCETSRFGMIFQFYHLLPELTTLENALAPLMIGRSALELLAASTPTCPAGQGIAGNLVGLAIG